MIYRFVVYFGIAHGKRSISCIYIEPNDIVKDFKINLLVPCKGNVLDATKSLSAVSETENATKMNKKKSPDQNHWAKINVFGSNP